MKIEKQNEYQYVCDFELWDRENHKMTTCGQPAMYRTNAAQNKNSLHCCEGHSANLKRKFLITPKDCEIKAKR